MTLKLSYLEELIRLVKYNQVPLVFVCSPKLGVLSSEYLLPAKELCDEYSVPFFDYYADSLCFQRKEWFKEPMHLNREGALLFSGMIARDIEMIKVIKTD